MNPNQDWLTAGVTDAHFHHNLNAERDRQSERRGVENFDPLSAERFR